MPRRGVDLVQYPEPPKKKMKVVEDAPSVDVSFSDDEALEPGIVFADVLQKKWRIGKPIGRGSFGRIYLASDEVDKEVTKQNARYVVKIEPHTNGPLFVEVHCLIRTAQCVKIKDWCLQKKYKNLGMPVYIASGSFTDENTDMKYRFLVLPRYDIDLQKIIARGRTLDLKNVLVLGLQIINVLEYLHNEGYTHSDIKSSNLMLGFEGTRSKESVKPMQSFQKETKEVSILSGKQRRPKTGKSTRLSNYYEDEDFVVKLSCDSFSEETNKKLNNVKKKLRKFLSNKDSRTLHRHHAFNLRQLSNYVNYEDMNSSVCSDQSYQKYLDEYENKKHIIYSSDERVHLSESKIRKKSHKPTPLPPIFNESTSDDIISQSSGQIYLLDYGLASKFLDSNGNHKDFGMDARKAHDGTLEYSSRDSHIGAHSRRSDLETLGYNLLDWLTGTLPWKTTEMLSKPDFVHALKKNFMSDVKSLLKSCFKTEHYPQFLEKYLQYVTSLDFTEKPDYNYCRSIFRNEFIKNGFGSEKDMSLCFIEPPLSPVNRKKLSYTKRFGRKNTPPDFIARNGVKKPFERENICSLENNLKLELLRQTLNSSSEGVRKPCTSRNFFISDADLVTRLKKHLMPHDVFGKKLSPKNLRSNRRNVQKRKGKRPHRNNIGKFGNLMGSARQFTWAEILAGNPEDIIRKDRTTIVENDDENTCKYRIRKMSNASDNSDNFQSPLMQKDYLMGMNPTYAMKEVLATFKKRVSGKMNKEVEIADNKLSGYTPAMIKIHIIKEKREAKEKMQKIKLQNAKKLSAEIEVKPSNKCTMSTRSKITKTITKTTPFNKKKSCSKSSQKQKTVPKSKITVVTNAHNTRSKTNSGNNKIEENQNLSKDTNTRKIKNIDNKKCTIAKRNPVCIKEASRHMTRSNTLRVTRSSSRRKKQ